LSVGRVTKPKAEATKAGFVKHDGQPRAPAVSQRVSQKSSLGDLRDAYLKAHEAAREVKTLYTATIHLNHLVTTLGRGFDL
jgi:hypothetical protein